MAQARARVDETSGELAVEEDHSNTTQCDVIPVRASESGCSPTSRQLTSAATSGTGSRTVPHPRASTSKSARCARSCGTSACGQPCSPMSGYCQRANGSAASSALTRNAPCLRRAPAAGAGPTPCSRCRAQHQHGVFGNPAATVGTDRFREPHSNSRPHENQGGLGTRASDERPDLRRFWSSGREFPRPVGRSLSCSRRRPTAALQTRSRPAPINTDATAPIGSWKTPWQAARKRAGLSIRFHDLRHSACTRMLEATVPLAVVADVLGWSPATTTKMSRLYGHIGDAARRQAMQATRTVEIEPGSFAFPFDVKRANEGNVAN
jgi:hypothetical protein